MGDLLVGQARMACTADRHQHGFPHGADDRGQLLRGRLGSFRVVWKPRGPAVGRYIVGLLEQLGLHD